MSANLKSKPDLVGLRFEKASEIGRRRYGLGILGRDAPVGDVYKPESVVNTAFPRPNHYPALGPVLVRYEILQGRQRVEAATDGNPYP